MKMPLFPINRESESSYIEFFYMIDILFELTFLVIMIYLKVVFILLRTYTMLVFLS